MTAVLSFYNVKHHHSTRGWKTTKRFNVRREALSLKPRIIQKDTREAEKVQGGKKRLDAIHLKKPLSLLLSFYEMQMEP
jgi:hypothetical protein